SMASMSFLNSLSGSGASREDVHDDFYEGANGNDGEKRQEDELLNGAARLDGEEASFPPELLVNEVAKREQDRSSRSGERVPYDVDNHSQGHGNSEPPEISLVGEEPEDGSRGNQGHTQGDELTKDSGIF